jgi:hypothetical protein
VVHELRHVAVGAQGEGGDTQAQGGAAQQGHAGLGDGDAETSGGGGCVGQQGDAVVAGGPGAGGWHTGRAQAGHSDGGSICSWM